MAVSSSVTDSRLNRPSTGRLGKKKVVFARVNLAGTYDGAGGFPALIILSTVGLKWADQILPMNHRSQDSGAGTDPHSIRFNRATQKITVHSEGITGHVEIAGGAGTSTLDLDLMIVGW